MTSYKISIMVSWWLYEYEMSPFLNKQTLSSGVLDKRPVQNTRIDCEEQCHKKPCGNTIDIPKSTRIHARQVLCVQPCGVIEKATEAVDEGKSIEILYIDFAKAFYKVPMKRLEAKRKRLKKSMLRW